MREAMTNETLREWIEKAQFTVTSPTHAPHVNEPILVVTVEWLLAELAGTYLSGVSGTTVEDKTEVATARDEQISKWVSVLLGVHQYAYAHHHNRLGKKVIESEELARQEMGEALRKIIAAANGDSAIRSPAQSGLPQKQQSGDGSESAGLRRSEQLGRETMRLAAMDAATGAQTSGKVELNEAVCAIADEIEKYTDKDLAVYRDMALTALAPAISRPSTQGSVSEVSNILKEVCEILGVELGPGLARYVPLIQRVREIAQPHSLPPSRADLGGDRIKGSCWRCGKPVLVKAGQAWHSKDDVVWHEVCSYQSQIEELTTQIAALKTDHALAEGQQSSELVEKTPSALPGEREARIAYVKNLAGVPIVERVTYPCGTTASEGSPPNDCPIHGSDCIGGVRQLLKRMTEAANGDSAIRSSTQSGLPPKTSRDTEGES